MSKGKGYGSKPPAKAEMMTPAAAKMSKPEMAMANIGEHYFHAASEQAPAGQYENTLLAIVDYIYTKGYKEAAKTIDAGEEVVMCVPKAPVKEDIILQDEVIKTKVTTTMFFDVMDEEDEDDTSTSKNVKNESPEDAEALDEEREQVYQTLLEVHKKEIDLFVKAKAKLKEGAFGHSAPLA